MQDEPRKNEIYADVLGRLSTLMTKKGDNIRSRIYSRAQDTVLGLTEDITDAKQLEGKPNIGPTIITKLTEYDETGTLHVFEREKENPEMWLTDIYGIGPKKAQELVKEGIKTIDDLRKRPELLNDTQNIGLKYYEDILQRIPRNEIDQYDTIFEESFQRVATKDAKYEIVGSYRRGAQTSGDIDVIITSKDADIFPKWINELKKEDIIVEILSQGKTKCLVIAKLPDAKHARRVDFMYTSPEEFPFAILYFTGSKSFNTVMRGYALKLGISLNEHGMYAKPKGKEKGEKLDKVIVDEEAIFTTLHLKYKAPTERIDGRAVETTLPIIPDTGIEKKGQNCYKSCDTVPGGECATGCTPSWTENKLIGSRNWCRCNIDKTDCAIKICPAHSEPDKESVKAKEPKQRKTRKVALDADGNPKEPKQRKTKKVALDADGNPKEPKPRKTNKKVKLNEIAPRLTIDQTTNNDIDVKAQVSADVTDLTELVPILHMDKVEKTTVTKAEPHVKKSKNVTIKRRRKSSTETEAVTEQNDKQEKNIKLTDHVENMDKRIHNATQVIARLRSEGIDVLDTMTENQLIDLATVAGEAYYNTKTAIMSDNEYDILKEYIERKYPTNPFMEEIGANVTKNKVVLPYKMASMDKIKPDTNALSTWTQKYTGPYVLSCKLDGVSGLYTTEGDVPKLYTRGNGTIGQDISHLLPSLKLPLEKNSVVRGEFIIPRVVFEEKYKSKFANPRNLVSGIINSKSVDAKVADIDFVAYEVIQPSLRPSEQMKRLVDLGHKVVQNKTEDVLTNEKLSETLLDWRTNYEYEIDGVIVTDDKIYPRKDGNPDHAFAFKMVISDQVAEAKVVDVLWTPSKNGYLKPRVRIEPIRLGGVTIEYATGFNGKYIETNKIGLGAVIQIIRSGDVIPYIKSVTTPAETAKMPSVGYHWTDTNVDIVLDNITDDDTVQAKNITDFFTGLEVEGLSSGNVKKIMNAGYTTIPVILRMSKDDFAKVEGFKTKMINKIYDGIHEQVEKASLITIMAASNKFGRGIGLKKIQPIMDAYPDILTSSETTDEKIVNLQTVDGIGKENAKNFAMNIPVFIEFLRDCDLLHKLPNTTTRTTDKTVEKVQAPVHDTSHILYDKHIVMTKVRDAEIKSYVESKGGVMDDNMSKKTFVLIVKTLEDVSNKTKKAAAENIPIMTPEMFKEKYMKE